MTAWRTGARAHMLAVLTSARLLLVVVGGLMSRPRELRAGIPLSAVAGVTIEDGSLMGMPMKALRITGTDETAFDLLVAAVHRKDAEALVAQYAVGKG